MYFNLLLIISAADKRNKLLRKIIKKRHQQQNKYTFSDLSFHIYSVRIIDRWSDRQALIAATFQHANDMTGFLQRSFIGAPFWKLNNSRSCFSIVSCWGKTLFRYVFIYKNIFSFFDDLNSSAVKNTNSIPVLARATLAFECLIFFIIARVT